ncbi:MAG TPA: DUF2868 domain-containing protein [Polaromonas sp.]|uniref:DUF2868 domain-containing protein n=1 Tax=Polaromonas sp. TaxID=1869339 RepID=UPI002D62FD63|nr:DUF2868 domain-containing protein [Polaromonas sp.]HYW56232.1 DUF2868 domain-containing protein [Polaromonas sp.]
MTETEHRARTTVLAQALENDDPRGDLVDLAARKAAALAAMNELGQISADGRVVPDDQLLATRARHLVDLLAAKHPALAALQRPGTLSTRLMLALPVLALLAGFATDRIGNPHRVDLLSAPLLIIIGFNLVVYGVLAVLALRSKPLARASWLSSLLQQVDSWRSRQPGPSARVMSGFHQRWQLVAGHLNAHCLKTVLHVSAAAWGAGVALSLAGRGLFVQYKVGWESTFLSAETVHRLLDLIFWLPTRVFNLTPLTLGEVTALRNFQNDSVAGARWVWMYVGLTALLVILPRLLLAAWSAVRARTASHQLRLDLSAPYYQGVLASMRRVHLKIGLAFASAATHAQFFGLARLVADDPLAQQLAISTPEGDRLQWVEEPVAASPVDCVLSTDTGGLLEKPVPPVWSGLPSVVVPAYRLTNSWPQWPVLTRALALATGSGSQAGWDRLESKLQHGQQQRLERSMTAVATCLTGIAVHINGDGSVTAIEKARDELFLALQQIHRLDRATGLALAGQVVQYNSPASTMGKKSLTAASAATGASVGAVVDASTGFLTLGAGTALGALLGAGIGWVTALRHKKGVDADVMRRLTEAALLLYLEVSNSVRVHADMRGPRDAWERELAKEIQQREEALSRLWSAREGAATDAIASEAEPVLMAAVQAVLATLYPPTTPVEVVGPGAQL